eukprot:gene15712-47219_t
MAARVSANRGVTGGTAADRLHASANGARAVVAHAAAGVRMAWELATEVDVAGIVRGT